MAFHYYVLFLPGDRGRPCGLMAFDPEGFHTVAYNHLRWRFEHQPDAVVGHVMGGDRSSQLREATRAEAEVVAAGLGTLLPAEAELRRLGDDAEGAPGAAGHGVPDAGIRRR